MDKRARKAQKRQKHTAEALAVFKKKLQQHGEGASDTITALETYVEKCCDTGVYLIDHGKFDESNKIFEDCAKVLKTDISGRFPALLYKIYYRQAQLMNAKQSHQEALLYLRQAMAMAEEQFRMDGDPLVCMPAETYLNAAIAFQHIERFSEALEAAENADQASKRAIMALSEVKQQPKAFRVMTPEEAENQLMIQLDIEIQSYLVRSQVYEKMNRFEDASQELQHGKILLEKHFGSQHPLMAEFSAVDHNIKLQVAPHDLDLNDRDGGSKDKDVDLNDISQLLDKRSELMKRGRVKRVYYQVTDQVQTLDRRGEFADLEHLEEKEKMKINSCVQAQSSWMQRQQLIAMRSQQDEQFRIMELLLSTQKSQVQECNYPKVFLPMQYGYQLPPQEQVTTVESSSEASESEEVEEPDEPVVVPEPEPVREPTPEPSSASSESDSMEENCTFNENMRNFESDDSESDKEEPPRFLMHNYDPIERTGRKPVRFSGYEDIFKEKNFKSDFSIKRIEIPAPVEPEPNIIIPPCPPEDDVEKKEWRELTLIILIQSRIRRFLRLRRRKKADHVGEVCAFFMKKEFYVFRIAIYKVLVAHTIKKKRLRHHRTGVRHRDETEMKTVEEKTEQLEDQEITEMMLMYHVLVECTSHSELGQSECLIKIVDFPYEFPYLIDYMRHAISIDIVEKKGKKYQVTFTKLDWTIEQELLLMIKRLLMEIENREARRHHNNSQLGQHESFDISDTRSYNTRIEEIDYEAIQVKLAEFAAEGIDLDALRAKIQFEARQLIENEEIKSTEIKQIVHRDIRKARDWTDHIRINTIKYEGPSKTVAIRKPAIRAIVKIQALIRGFLARKNKPKGPVWKLIFDFVVHQNQNYYNVRVFKAPDQLKSLDEPYLVVATRYLCAKDTFKLRLRQLPFKGETCKSQMIETINIVSQQNTIQNIIFAKKQDPVGAAFEEVSDIEIDDEFEHEFIDDWEEPDKERGGIFMIRKFKIYPYITVKFGLERSKEGDHYRVSVIYRVSPSQSSGDSVVLHKLPTALENMVYFLRQHLKVNMKENDMTEVNYVSISEFAGGKRGKRVFEAQMRKLREKLRMKQLQAKVQEQLRLKIQEHVVQYGDSLDAEFEKFECDGPNDDIYVVQMKKNVQDHTCHGTIDIIPYRLIVYRKTQPSDMDFINFTDLKQFGDQVLRNYIKRHLLIYLDPETELIKYIAIEQTGRVAEQKPKDILAPLWAIIKVQALIRRFLVRCRVKKQFDGYVTRFIRKFKDGQRARITVWKTIVEKTSKKKKIQTKTKKKGGVVQDEQTQQVGEEVHKERLDAYQIVVENVYLENNEHQKIILEIPPKEILIETLNEVLVIEWKNDFEYTIEREGVLPFKVDWIEGIKYTKIDKELINKMTAQKKMNKIRGLGSLTRKIGRDDRLDWDQCHDYRSGQHVFGLFQSSNATKPDSSFIQIRAFLVDARGHYDPIQIAGIQTLSVQEVWNLFNPSRSGEDLSQLDFVDVLYNIGFEKRESDWEIVLTKACSVMVDHSIMIDEIEFKKNRYNFDPSQIRNDAKAVTATLVMQRGVRRFLHRQYQRRMMREPGFAMATGVYKTHGQYFVYIFRSDLSQTNVILTVKQRRDDGERDPVVDRHAVSESVVETAVKTYDQERFKLQSVDKFFKATLEEACSAMLAQPTDWKSFMREHVENKM